MLEVEPEVASKILALAPESSRPLPVQPQAWSAWDPAGIVNLTQKETKIGGWANKPTFVIWLIKNRL